MTVFALSLWIHAESLKSEEGCGAGAVGLYCKAVCAPLCVLGFSGLKRLKVY